jgi:hypothetical protein
MLFAAASAALLVTPLSTASTKRSYTFKTRQGPTAHTAHPPAGTVGDTFDSTLVLRNAGLAQLGGGTHAKVGSMKLSFTIRKACSGLTNAKCDARADIETVSTLPGGNVTAGGRLVSIVEPSIRIPVTGGSGRFRGARGWVTISPSASKLSTFELTLP